MVSLQLPVAVYISIYGASALCKQLLLLHDLLPGLLLCLTLKLPLLVNPLGTLDALALLRYNHLLLVYCLLRGLRLLRHAVIFLFIIYHSGFLPLSSRHFLFLLQLLFTAIYLLLKHILPEFSIEYLAIKTNIILNIKIA